METYKTVHLGFRKMQKGFSTNFFFFKKSCLILKKMNTFRVMPIAAHAWDHPSFSQCPSVVINNTSFHPCKVPAWMVTFMVIDMNGWQSDRLRWTLKQIQYFRKILFFWTKEHGLEMMQALCIALHPWFQAGPCTLITEQGSPTEEGLVRGTEQVRMAEPFSPTS